MIEAFIIFGGFLSLCSMVVGGFGILMASNNPAPGPNDPKWPLWYFGLGLLFLVLFIIWGFHHG